MKKGILFISILIFSALSCKNKTPEVTSDLSDIISTEIPSEFLDFYMKFHSDSIYQVEHIVFPLKQKSDGTYWDKEGWRMHQPFNDHGGQFQRQFLSIKSIVIEKITSGNGMYEVVKRYTKTEDGYDLIYYTVMNAFENSEDWEKGE